MKARSPPLPRTIMDRPHGQTGGRSTPAPPPASGEESATHAGARGYVTKTSAGAELVLAIRSVLAGQIFVSPGILPMPADSRSVVQRPRGSFEHLSDRERQVLRSLVKGCSSADIGRELSLSPKSVDTYRHRIMVKLGAGNRAELIRLALEHDLTVV